MKYLIDTNILIGPMNTCYGFNFCPGYWDWLVHLARNEHILLIGQIYTEVVTDNQGGDELAAWARSNKTLFGEAPSDATQRCFQQIASYIMGIADQFQKEAPQKFLDCADPWLIATAMSMEQATIVTDEKLQGPPPRPTKGKNLPKHIKIPNVCLEMGVQYINLWQFMRIEALQPYFTFDPAYHQTR